MVFVFLNLKNKLFYTSNSRNESTKTTTILPGSKTKDRKGASLFARHLVHAEHVKGLDDLGECFELVLDVLQQDLLVLDDDLKKRDSDLRVCNR